MTSFTVRSAVDLVVLAPHVLGFRPTDSVVLLSIGPGGGFHARIDLPRTRPERHAVADLLVAPFERQGAAAVALLVFTADAARARAVGRVMADRLERAGLEVLDALRVEESRFFPLDEPDHPGTEYDLASHPLSAERVFRGERLYATRQEMAAELRPRDPDLVAAVAVAADAWAERMLARGATPGHAEARVVEHQEWLRRQIRRWQSEEAPFEVAEVARALVLLGLGPIRDVAWASLDRAEATAQLSVWKKLVGFAPPDLLPGVSAVLALVAWLAGDGALAWCAIERAADAPPDAPRSVLTEFVEHQLIHAVSPDEWVPLTDVPDRTDGDQRAG